MKARYAAGPTAIVYKDENGKKSQKKLIQLLWGDLVDLREEPSGDYARVGVRIDEGTKIHSGWMKKSDIQSDPVLEVTFVDIGQGDGCLLILPDVGVPDFERRSMVIDAGEKDNMMRYIKYRFMYPSANRPKEIHAGIISHPDQDHYKGFAPMFKQAGLSFKTLYHNGLVERKGNSVLGPQTTSEPKLFTHLIKTKTQLKTLLDKDAKIAGRKSYPDMLRAANDAEKFGAFKMLSRDDQHLAGFGPDDEVTIQVLGPVPEKNNQGKTGLRNFGNTGFTKNGHSVVLRLIYGNVRILLGGDLNIPSEKLLLKTIMGKDVPENKSERAKYINAARKKLEVDIAKSCHHGSADFSSLFLEAVNPVVTVISSGDSEPHSHPRAETLGAIGVNSRGERPLIFSTELARSAKDAIRNPRLERKELKDAHDAVLKATAAHNGATTAAKKAAAAKKIKAAEKAFRKLVDATIERTVQVYGAIYVRSNGEEVVIAQRIERSSAGRQWDASVLRPNARGELEFQSKYLGD
jgi:beta-lactamase superfamily II metal-dependent hydrolase